MTPLTDLDEANSKILELHAEIQRLRALLATMRRQMFGRRREKIDPNQLLLFESSSALLAKLEEEAETAEAPQKKKPKPRSPKGRKPFPEHLPREEIHLGVPEDERCCSECGEGMVQIGVEVTERGHIIPAKLIVRRYTRDKFACPKGHAIKTADLPAGVIDKGRYEASVYAHVVTAKYGDHLPLHRVQGMFRRQGVHLPKQSMWDMLVRFDELVAQPVLAEMRRQLLEESELQADETTVKVQMDGGRGTRRGVLWVWRNVRGSPREKVIADFKDDRSARGPDEFLGDWQGTLQTDGYDGVNPIAIRNRITRAGCWSHGRRKFYDAFENGSAKASVLLRPIQRLFWIERAILARARELELDLDGLASLRIAVRQRRSKVVLRDLYDKVFALDEDPATRSDDQVARAITYLVKQRQALLAHLENGRIPIHNNDTERDIRHIVTGRKNWMTFASEKGGQVAGRIYSLVMSCKLAGICIETYLEDLLGRIANTPASQIASLTPWGWAEARDQEKRAAGVA